ncbi:MAG: hypothetical protein DRH26_06805, partial [Deltaproteobacteria bacterium]
DIISDVAKAFQTADENEKLFLTSQLVGIRQSAKMVEVFNGLAKTTEITATAMDSAGSAALEVAARLQSSEVAVERFKAGWKNLGIIIGDQFSEAATGVINGGTEIENTLRNIVNDGTFAPIFDSLNDFGEKFEKFLYEVAEAMPEAFADIKWDDLVNSMGNLGDEIVSFFGDLDLTDPEDLAKAIQGAVDTIEFMITTTRGMIIEFEPLWDAMVEGIKRFKDMDEQAQLSFGKVLAAAKMVTEAGVLVAVAVVAIKESGFDVGRAFDIVIGSMRGLWNGFQTIMDLAVLCFTRAIQYLSEAGAALTFGDTSDRMKEQAKLWENFADAVDAQMLENASDAMDGYSQAWDGITGRADKATEAVKETGKAIEGLPESKDVAVEVDTAEAEEIIQWVDEEVYKPVAVETDKESIKTVQKTIDRELSGKQEIEIDPQIEIAKLKETSEVVQRAIEWQAKLDIANVEANAKRVEAIMATVSTAIDSTGNLIGDLFGMLSGDVWGADKWAITAAIKKEQEYREEAMKQSKEMFEIEKKIAEEKLRQMESGEGIIKIEADGMEPQIEAFMWAILEKIQIRANESQSEFLLGV